MDTKTAMSRDSYFDNAKFWLMAMVVFSHLFQPFIEANSIYEDIYFFLFTIHMPAFILISGYFSKSSVSSQRWKNNFSRYILLYVVFQYIYAFYYWATGIHGKMSFDLITPHWSLWFLVCLAFWQAGLYLFHKLPPVAAVILSLCLSLLVGYVPFIGRQLTLQRLFVFFPYYLLGYYLPAGAFKKIRNKNILKILGVMIWAALFLIIFKLEKINKYWVFGSKAYEDFMAIPEFGPTVRLFVFLLSFIGVFGFFCLVPERKRWYTKYGAKTLTIYLLHGFIVKGTREMIGSTYLPGIILISLTILFSFLLTVLLGSEKITQGINALTSWLFQKIKITAKEKNFLHEKKNR